MWHRRWAGGGAGWRVAGGGCTRAAGRRGGSTTEWSVVPGLQARGRDTGAGAGGGRGKEDGRAGARARTASGVSPPPG